MMNCVNRTLINLWRKNRVVVRNSHLISAEIVVIFIIFLSNFSLDTNDKIGSIDRGVYMSVTYYLMPLFLLILFFKIYWEEFNNGYVMIDLLSGYSRTEIISIKLLTGIIYSMFILFFPFFLNSIIFYIVKLSIKLFLDSFKMVVNAFLNYVLYAAFLNTLFILIFLSFKTKSSLKYILWIMEIGFFFLVHILLAGRTDLLEEYLLFAVIVAFNIAILIRIFKVIDL